MLRARLRTHRSHDRKRPASAWADACVPVAVRGQRACGAPTGTGSLHQVLSRGSYVLLPTRAGHSRTMSIDSAAAAAAMQTQPIDRERLLLSRMLFGRCRRYSHEPLFVLVERPRRSERDPAGGSRAETLTWSSFFLRRTPHQLLDQVGDALSDRFVGSREVLAQWRHFVPPHQLASRLLESR